MVEEGPSPAPIHASPEPLWSSCVSMTQDLQRLHETRDPNNPQKTMNHMDVDIKNDANWSHINLLPLHPWRWET